MSLGVLEQPQEPDNRQEFLPLSQYSFSTSVLLLDPAVLSRLPRVMNHTSCPTAAEECSVMYTHTVKSLEENSQDTAIIVGVLLLNNSNTA